MLHHVSTDDPFFQERVDESDAAGREPLRDDEGLMGTSVLVMVDVEATGPCPGLHSMKELGAVVVEEPLARTFYARLRPIEGTALDKDATRVMGHAPATFAAWPDPEGEMRRFAKWLDAAKKRPMFVSGNPGFDFQFVNYYF